MSDFNPDCVLIPLSKTGTNAGKYTTIVSPEDADLADLNWTVRIDRNNNQYAQRSLRNDGKHQSEHLHRVILQRILNRQLVKGEYVDHIDGNGVNNTRPNLRLATNSQNLANTGKARSNTSGYKGVFKHGVKWLSKIMVNRKSIHLGLFATKEEAHLAYCEAAKKYFGDFAKYN